MVEINYSGLKGKVVKKTDFNYDESIKSWNRAIEKSPLAIVYCESKEDVSNAIVWAKERALPIRVRSGGHHYEGYSTGNDVFVIDISNLNKIYIDELNNFVTIQGGVRNRELYEFLGDRGYPFPGGGCPTVGVAGFTLGGGWGYSARLFGLACDNLIELKMVDYNGNIIVANENMNEDLFWACRGAGGGNFGVVVEMKFNIPQKIEMATLIHIDYRNISIKENLNIFKLWQDRFKTLDNKMNLKMAIYNSVNKGRGVLITGLFYGEKEKAEEILKDFKDIKCKIEFNLQYITVIDANRKIQDSHPDYEKYKSSGRFACNDYTVKEMESLIRLIEERPIGSEYVAVSLYGLGGAITKVDKMDTAFYYRDAKFILGIQSVWENSEYAEINKEWVKDRVKYIETKTKGAFINFPFAELNDYEKEYYGENIFRLKEIKTKYDPQNIFNFPQSIKGSD